MTDSEIWFEQAREHAHQGRLTIVREDGQCLVLPALAKASVKPEMLAAVERIIPTAHKRNIVVIADTSWAGDASTSIQAANRAIPFFGLLMGFTALGHSAWIFSGNPYLLTVGCSQADVLIVDSASLVSLPSDWQAAAKRNMRIPQVLVHDRVSFKLRSA